MPLVKVMLSESLAADAQSRLLQQLSTAVGEILEKPAQYIMATLECGPVMLGGTTEKAALVEIRSIGKLNGRMNARLTEAVCAILLQEQAIASSRVFITFSDVAPAFWGWNNQTFG